MSDLNEMQKTMRDRRAAELYPRSPGCRNAFRNGFRNAGSEPDLLNAPAISEAFRKGKEYRKSSDQEIRDMLVRQEKEGPDVRHVFTPRPCPCGCKKWIMAPWFACQCSSVTVAERDDLVRMARDAARWGKVQNAVIDAIEKAKSAKLATGEYNHDYDIGYSEAKRDVLIEIAAAFEEIENV